MYIITRYDVKEDVEKIVDVVSTFEDLSVYITELLKQTPDLVLRPDTIPAFTRVGILTPFASNATVQYYFSRFNFVSKPSDGWL
jgi:hypothetical protein